MRKILYALILPLSLTSCVPGVSTMLISSGGSGLDVPVGERHVYIAKDRREKAPDVLVIMDKSISKNAKPMSSGKMDEVTSGGAHVTTPEGKGPTIIRPRTSDNGTQSGSSTRRDSKTTEKQIERGVKKAAASGDINSDSDYRTVVVTKR